MNSPVCAPEDLAAVRTTLRVLDSFRALDPEMPLGEVVSFLLIAEAGGISPAGLGSKGGFSASAASRYAQALGAKGGRGNRPAKELITSRRHETNGREIVLELSGRGELLLGQLRQALRPWTTSRPS